MFMMQLEEIFDVELFTVLSRSVVLFQGSDLPTEVTSLYIPVLVGTY